MKKFTLMLAMIIAISCLLGTNRSEVTIGDGNQLSQVPVDMYWRNSLYQCLYSQNELGIASGTIQEIRFYNNFTTNLPGKPTRIWLGSTTLTNLSNGWIPSTQMQLVWDGGVNYPAGQNTIQIVLQNQYMYSGGNLVMMVQRPMDNQYFANTDRFLVQDGGVARALKAQSDNVAYNPAIPPDNYSITELFPRTTFVYQGAGIENDLASISIIGSSIPIMDTPSEYVIGVRNNGTLEQTAYSVKLMKSGGIELVGMVGLPIAPGQDIYYTLTWSPTQIENIQVYAQVLLDGDQVPANDISPSINVYVQMPGTEVVTIGTGVENARIPIDMNWMNSLYQTVYPASELNSHGLITGLRFYNHFEEHLPAKRVRIWLAETALENLAAAWVPSSQMSLVFDGLVDFPIGQNEIMIPLQQPFYYQNGNLLMMVHRPQEGSTHSMFNYFKSQSVGTNRSRVFFAHTIVLDPANPPEFFNLSGQFPKTTFMIVSSGTGILQGTVYGADQHPLPGAIVTVGAHSVTTSVSGFYSLPLPVGVYTVDVSAAGYYDQSLQNVVVSSGETSIQDFYLHPLIPHFQDGFETYPNFALYFSPWTLHDVDQSETYGISGFYWPNVNEPMAYMIFNPNATTPPMQDAEPHSGSKYAVCIASSNGANNDWLISPPVKGGGEVRFWARSYVDVCGLERFMVLVSTTGTNPEDFSVISGPNYLEAPTTWTEYVYNLAQYSGQQIYVAIRCVSFDAVMFMVDDFSVGGVSSTPDEIAPSIGTALLGNYPNPFNPHTTIRFYISDREVDHEISIYNSRGQKVRTLHNGRLDIGTHTLIWDGRDDYMRPVASGVYFYRLSSQRFSQTRRMLLLK